jgi:hypothetical protein
MWVLLTLVIAQTFVGSQEPLSPEIRASMVGVSWREGCPVSLDALVLLRISHWDFDGQVKHGELVVAKEIADSTLAVFKTLFEARVAIAQVKRIEEFGGDDNASMAANNTSGFNCRYTPGSKRFSKHAFGRAIDLNPRQNPYVKGDEILPPEGKAHLDRRAKTRGLIEPNGKVTRAFRAQGFRWGGNWKSLKDYQHFEKP